MLLANISAATAVASAFPDRALLRRHPQPNPRKLAAAASAAKEAGAHRVDHFVAVHCFVHGCVCDM